MRTQRLFPASGAFLNERKRNPMTPRQGLHLLPFGATQPRQSEPVKTSLGAFQRWSPFGVNLWQTLKNPTKLWATGAASLHSAQGAAVGPAPTITFDPANQVFKLQSGTMSYFLHVNPEGDLEGLHWGKPVDTVHPELLKSTPGLDRSWQPALDLTAREFPDMGRGDTKTPAVKITAAQGQSSSQFKYVGHEIRPGLPALKNLPQFHEAETVGNACKTLIVRMRDDVTKVDAELTYSVLPEFNAVIRGTQLINRGSEPVQIEKLASFSTDFPPEDYRLLTLSGTWIREAQEETVPLKPGKLTIASNRGFSSHAHNPFITLLRPDATEDHGDAYGVALVYSGSFSAEVEQNVQQHTRLTMGLNPDCFSWRLQPGERFETPLALGVYSDQGLNGLSRQFHSVFRKHLVRKGWADKTPPVLLNTWEAVYFNVNHPEAIEIAKKAKALGVELLVVDDGWFGVKYPRNNDQAGLGDWVENPDKLPGGLQALGKAVNGLGLKFGIWVEPEMVNPNSELYEQHPDWVLHQPGRARTQQRNQLVLDLGRTEVQDHLIQSMSRLFDAGHIQYVKWDLNRLMTEVGSAALPPRQQKEAEHRYMLGIYRVLKVLTEKYPDILFEGCASGGGRFDAGMLPYFSQSWASDNTDAASRLAIQSGFARAYPIKGIGAHVSDVPNHQVGRTTSLKFRFHTAMSANLGLELDPRKMTPDETAFAKAQIALYKTIRPIVQDGHYRVLRPSKTNNWPAWMFSRPDGSEAVVFAFQKQAEPGLQIPMLKLAGLEEGALYSVSGLEKPVSGAYLMHVGLRPAFEGDYDSALLQLKRLKN